MELSPAPYCIAFLAVAIIGACGDSAGGGDEPLAQQQEALRIATVTENGFLNLGVSSSGNIFEFRLQVPVDTIVVQEELVVDQQPDCELLFTAMVPVADGGLGEGGPDESNCHMEVRGGEEFQVCEVPYVGYGSEEPTKVTIGGPTDSGIAIVYFHEFGTQDGDKIRMDYLLLHAREHEDACQLFYDFSRSPEEFIVGKELIEPPDKETIAGAAVGGPVFSIDMVSLAPSPDSPGTQSCSLALFPSLFKDFCPMPESSAGSGPSVSSSHWYDRCSNEYPDLDSYPVI